MCVCVCARVYECVAVKCVHTCIHSETVKQSADSQRIESLVFAYLIFCFLLFVLFLLFRSVLCFFVFYTRAFVKRTVEVLMWFFPPESSEKVIHVIEDFVCFSYYNCLFFVLFLFSCFCCYV